MIVLDDIRYQTHLIVATTSAPQVRQSLRFSVIAADRAAAEAAVTELLWTRYNGLRFSLETESLSAEVILV